MSYIVTLPYDPMWPELDWAKKNCPSYITNDAQSRGYNDTLEHYKVNYYFSEQKDANWFALRWIK